MDDDVRNIGIAYDTALAFFYGGMLGQKSVLNMLMMSYGALAVVV
ncbi:ammonium transporter [Corynebacterium diphtheriae]|nr:ammonium transporter [Corynebacterium diphtheriae]